jgi:hypothetical protein
LEVRICKTEVGDSLDLLLGPLADIGFCQPDGSFITSVADLGRWLGEMARCGEAVVVDGLATRVQRPCGWGNQMVLYDAKRHAHAAQAWRSPRSGVTCCGWMAAGRAAATSTSCLRWQGWARCWTAVPWAGKGREHWHAPVGDRRTDAQRSYSHLQARLRAPVEQTIAQLAGAWALRRWCGLLDRVRDVYRTTGAGLPCRWPHPVPT